MRSLAPFVLQIVSVIERAQGIPEQHAMRKKTCEICGKTIEIGDLVTYQIIPQEIAKQAGISEPRTATLCTDCSNEVQTWYVKKVSTIAYDDRTKRFVPKSPAEMLKEYVAAYIGFTTYKKQS